jgi:glycosyltransferase involved in cell wall biosynthesis
VIIPARNEERHLPGCLAAFEAARMRCEAGVELIVVLNRCTDGTERIAREAGAVIVREEAANLSRIRNAGAAVATGEILVTCDADSRAHPDSLANLLGKLESGRWVGGGCVTLPERWSAGIVASLFAVLPYLAWHGVSFGMFWCRAEDFRAIGGFDERMVSIEDLDFAKRLKAHGRKTGRGFGTLWRTPLITSCRKFDHFGDWYLFRNPAFVRRVFTGTDRAAADEFWYEIER